MHEVGHYIKRDLFLKCFFEILCLLYWWNPLVYIVRYYFSNILEIRNDLIVCNELSEIEESIYEHCKKAINISLNFWENGLPKIGSGDWNDGFSTVGNKGKGESIWLGFFLYDVLK